jgi:hypothetical protein
MEMETASETSDNSSILRWLIAREDLAVETTVSLGDQFYRNFLYGAYFVQPNYL